MALMSSLYVGNSGLQTSQNALNTTAHNLSNIETKGYVRQQVLLGDRTYNSVGTIASISPQQQGLGVEYSKSRQVRDYFLDLSYRRESGRGSFYDICYETTNELENQLGELNGAAFADAIDGMWTAVEELQKDPSSSVNQGQFVAKCSEFIQRAQSVYNGLQDYQDNLNARVKDMVDKINDIGEKIVGLNTKILTIELGCEEANDLRDERNNLLDELAGYTNMTYTEDIDGVVEVAIEGMTFVVRGTNRPFEMGYIMDNTTGFYTPTWPYAGNDPVFNNLNEEICTANNTNIGELKSLVLARGDRRANYTDISSEYYDSETGKTVDLYNDGATDKMATANSIVMNAMAELDQLVHKMVTDMNDILAGEQSQIQSGTNPTYDSEKKCAYELFERIGSERYELNGSGQYEYVSEDTSRSPSDISTMYSITNLRINPDLLKTPSLLGYPDAAMTRADGSVDQTKADALADAFANESMVLNPNVTKISNYRTYYSDMVSQQASAGSVYKSFSEAQALTVDSLDDSRQQIMGVDSNEELSNMIKFQNAYNASSRFINAVSEMLDHLIQKLG